MGVEFQPRDVATISVLRNIADYLGLLLLPRTLLRNTLRNSRNIRI